MAQRIYDHFHPGGAAPAPETADPEPSSLNRG
jgi:hypothetical protein